MFVWKQDQALKYIFCLLHFTIHVTDYKKMSHGGGGGGNKMAEKLQSIFCLAR
jgi:hypothetical protein